MQKLIRSVVTALLAGVLSVSCGGSPSPTSPTQVVVVPPAPPAPAPPAPNPGDALRDAMVRNLPSYIASAIAKNQDLLGRNPGSASQIQAKIAMLQDPTLLDSISANERWYVSSSSRPMVALFPLDAMRSGATDSVLSIERALPLLENVMGSEFPVSTIRIWYGFVVGATGGYGILDIEDRETYESRGGGALPFEAIVLHETSHAYIPHESLNQFLELYLYNMLHVNSTDVRAWIFTRNYSGNRSANVDIHAILDVYSMIGPDAMARAYRIVHRLNPPYGQPLSAECKQAFIDQAPEPLKTQVADKMSRVTY